MKINQLIKKLSAIEKRRGNIDVFIEADGNGPYWVENVDFMEVENKDDYPKHYNMRVGYKFVQIRS